MQLYHLQPTTRTASDLHSPNQKSVLDFQSRNEISTKK